ncbi:MAG: triose-phosphate isomerase [Ezakiella sp.]|nr:triose-phosphate isomerase [Ezakiella sp.]MDD7472038.1 triose-phosphate isomerase [Bacillota bacterium]MDY3924002.1 triose-phosphate isomerase [Ezakiella sp.]
MRNKILAANWKMNLNRLEAFSLLQKISNMTIRENDKEIVFVPSVFLPMCEEVLTNSCVFYGAQNVYFEEKGAFTGELSITHISDFGARYALVGHSERRNIFGENSELLNKKLKGLLSHNITPVLCIGEPLKERENKTYEAFLYKQLKEAMVGICAEDAKKIIYAYEPIWAIGTGKTARPGDIKTTLEFIRNTLNYMYEGIKEEVYILYGGSVKKDNIDEIINTNHCDGVLVGGAALDFDSWNRIVNYEVK